jgi:hypothetical protein
MIPPLYSAVRYRYQSESHATPKRVKTEAPHGNYEIFAVPGKYRGTKRSSMHHGFNFERMSWRRVARLRKGNATLSRCHRREWRAETDCGVQ